MKQSQTLPDLECACASVRRTSRLITQLYAQEMGPHLEPSQFALLTALKSHPGYSHNVLSEALGFDKTTLSRNLSLMKRKGWIVLSPAEDKRERGYVLSPAGSKLLAAAKPGWARAQQRLRNAMTAAQWDAITKALAVAARAAHAALKVE